MATGIGTDSILCTIIFKKKFVNIITYHYSAESSIILETLKYSVTKIENIMTCEELIKIPNPHMKNSIQQDGFLISFIFSVLMLYEVMA